MNTRHTNWTLILAMWGTTAGVVAAVIAALLVRLDISRETAVHLAKQVIVVAVTVTLIGSAVVLRPSSSTWCEFFSVA